MALDAVAEPPADVRGLAGEQLQPAPTPADDRSASAGMQVFLTRACVMCHTIRGTSAPAAVGPDLTHVGSRRTHRRRHPAHTRAAISAAGSSIRRASSRASHMPADASLSRTSFDALLAYLESLQ